MDAQNNPKCYRIGLPSTNNSSFPAQSSDQYFQAPGRTGKLSLCNKLFNCSFFQEEPTIGRQSNSCQFWIQSFVFYTEMLGSNPIVSPSSGQHRRKTESFLDQKKAFLVIVLLLVERMIELMQVICIIIYWCMDQYLHLHYQILLIMRHWLKLHVHLFQVCFVLNSRNKLTLFHW